MTIARITFIGFALLGLTGCLGGNTYGTGVSQEKQLLKDVSSLVMLGGDEDKETIDYSARPELVRPDNVAVLPAPEVNAAAADGNFPTDPEAGRAAALKRGDDWNRRSGALTGSGKNEALASADGPAIEKPTILDSGALSGRGDAPITDVRVQKRQRAAVLEARKRLAGGTAAQGRRYLTDPPDEYRQPADTAAVGDTGARERREKKKIENVTAFNPQS